MCNRLPHEIGHGINQELDEQRAIYLYQCFNVLMKLLDNHLDNSYKQDIIKEQDKDSLIQSAYLAWQSGEINQSQYQEIMSVLMNPNKTSHSTTTYRASNRSANGKPIEQAIYRLLGGSN